MWKLLILSSVSAEQVDTGALRATLEGDQLTALVAASGVSWLTGPTAVYDLGTTGFDADLTAQALPDGQLLLRLSLSNPSEETAQGLVEFPLLDGLQTTGSEELKTFFPALGPIYSDVAATHRRYYGVLFPLQFMALEQGDAGLWMMTRDTTGRRKTFSVSKSTGGQGGFRVEWPDLRLEPGETAVLEVSLGVGDGDWHNALGAYRRWVRTWYHPRTLPKPAFQEAFNLRQLQLHPNGVLGDHPGAFDPETGTYSLQEYLAQDVSAFGGVDWVHLFDWGMDWVHGRVGDYNPWSYLGDPEGLQAEVDALQAQGIGVGLYVEGYLLDTTSLVGLSWGDDWEMETSSGDVYTNYAPSWHVCPGEAGWRDHFALRNGRRTELRVGASGLYVDQFGYGYQYLCHREDHEHSTPSPQIKEEIALMTQLRKAMSPDQVLYSEASPVDVGSQWQDGAFTEAVSSFRHDDRTLPFSSHRFGLPGFKTFELLTQDAPLADDVQGVRLTFFNGEGTRHMGYLEDDPWFDAETLAEIAQAWSVLRTYREAFTGAAPSPIVDTANEGVVANLFPASDHRLWTLYNTTDSPISGEVLTLDTVPDATWWDCWNDQVLTPETLDGFASIVLSLGPGEVGCVVEQRPPNAPVLVAHWAFDESGAARVVDSVGAADGELWPEGQGPVSGASAPSARYGTAYEFDGQNAISLGPVPALSALTGNLSLAAWVWPDQNTGVHRILGVDSWADGGLVFGLTQSGGQQALALTTVGAVDYVLPLVIPTDRWSHVAVVLDAGATAHFYVDGEPRGNVVHHTPGIVSSADWWIGSNGTDGYWSGGLDDLRVYDGAVSPETLRSLADTAPPMAGWVQAPEEPWTDSEELTLWWPGFHDPSSPIDDYQIAVGTTHGADDLLSTTVSGASQLGDFGDLALPEGTVYMSVTATDGVGLQTTVHGTVQVSAGLPDLLEEWLFDRSLDAVSPVPVAPELERTENFSLTAWIAPSEAQEMTIIGSDSGGWALGLSADGDLVFVTRGQEEHVLQAGIGLGEWTHVAAVYDRYSDITLYVNGQVAGVGLGTIPASLTQDAYYVGGQDTPWVGGLDQVRLYDGPLRPGQVADIVAGEPEDTENPSDTDFGGPVDSGRATADCGCSARGLGGVSWLWLGVFVLCATRATMLRG
jgi:hypothetical protein